MTFSIVARDPASGALGIATATAGPAVGALVVHGAAGVGAIATQAMTNPLYGISGLDYLRQGLSAAQTLEKLLEEDAERHRRQVMLVDARGEIAHWTGNACSAYSGCLHAGECVVGGNLLLNAVTLESMLHHYHQRAAEHFADRLFAALEAAAAAGGDKRGIHSAAVKIWFDRAYASVDARVDWSLTPLDALKTVLLQQRAASYADFFAQLPKGKI